MLVYTLALRGVLLGLLVCWPCCIALSASNSSRQRPPEVTGNRYLFIVENSSAMEKRDESLRQTMFEFINTGMRGRMQAGDTFGVWTFNSQPETRFPMQIWTPSSRLDLATRVNMFLKEQGYKKRSNIERVWRDLEAVIASINDVTVVLVTDGNDRISGTPFDKEINGKYRQMNADPAAQKEAFVTAFMLKEGQFIAYSVNRPAENLNLPPAAERPKPRSTPLVRHSDAVSPPTAPTAPPPSVRRVPSIIVTKDTLARENDPLSNVPPTPPPVPQPPVAAPPIPAAATPPQKTAVDPELGAKSAPPDLSRAATPPPSAPPVPSGIVTPNPRVRLAVSPGAIPGAAASVTSPIVVVSPAVSLPPLPEAPGAAKSSPTTSSPPVNPEPETTPSASATRTAPLPSSALQPPQAPKPLPTPPPANPTASAPLTSPSAVIPSQPNDGAPPRRAEETTARALTSPPPPAASTAGPAMPVVPPAPRLTAQILPPTGAMPVHARSLSAPSNTVSATVALAPTAPVAPIGLNAKLILAGLMLAGAAGCFWVHRQRVRQARQTSFISRALPRSPSASATGKP